MIAMMSLLRTKVALTRAHIERDFSPGAEKGRPDAHIMGEVFNLITDHSQVGIDYPRGALEFDAIGQVFFADISSSMTAANAGAVDLTMGLSQSLIDEVDLILCLQNTVVAPPDGDALKRMSILRKRPDVSDEQFQNQWLDLHAVLAKRLPGVVGYRQNLVIDGPRDADGHKMMDGMAELWFTDRASLENAFSAGPGATLMTHAREFISEITTFLVEPTLILGRS